MLRINNIIIHVIIPMIIGGLLYILYRDNSLLMFYWFRSLGIENFIILMRENVLLVNKIPNWVIFNLPNGIWIYSLTSLMLIIWYKDINKLKYIWLAIGPIIGISAEIGQFIHILPGTFDTTDLILCFFAGIAPFIIFKPQMKRRIQ